MNTITQAEKKTAIEFLKSEMEQEYKTSTAYKMPWPAYSTYPIIARIMESYVEYLAATQPPIKVVPTEQIVYVPTEVNEELPEDDKYCFVLALWNEQKVLQLGRYYSEDECWTCETKNTIVTHWLKPVLLSSLRVPTDWKERFKNKFWETVRADKDETAPDVLISYIEQNLLSSKEFEGGGQQDAINLLAALLSGKELFKDYEISERQSLWCEKDDFGHNHFFVSGWASAGGKPEDRILDIINNPEKWKIAQENQSLLTNKPQQ